MIRLVIVKNPFQPWQDRIVKDIPYGLTAGSIAKLEDFDGVEINCAVNGHTIEAIDDYVIPDNHVVVMSPVVAKSGKSILGIVAMIGLTVAAGALSGGAFSGWGAAFAKGAWGAYALAAGVMAVGSLLINKYLTPKPDMGMSGDNNPTYSWGGVQTLEGQNNPITMTYGKVMSGGQTIGKHITVENDKEYLNWLIAAGEGPVEITDVKLNDNLATNFDGVDVEIRNGTNDQEIIPYFNDTYFTKNLAYQLMDEARIDTAQGNATEKLIVKIEFSNGLYHANNKGNLEEAWVDVKGWFRLEGTNTWNLMFDDRVKDKQSSAVRREYTTDRINPGRYEVKVQVTDRQYEVTNTTASTRCWWTALTSVVFDDFIYPNIGLIGIRALASDQISGSPSLSFLKERAKVWVYNPASGTYVEKDASNPAWAAYDMLHLCSRLKNINTGEYEFEARGCSEEMLIYEQFAEWADFCDEKNLRVNIEISQTGELLDVVNQNIASCGRGAVIRFGTRYGCVWDCVKQPVQMFGMGNIIAGTFEEEFLETSDRANGVEITYTDASMDYSRNTITIYSDTYDTDAEEKLTQITMNGVTSYEQAYREGKFQLYCNKYLLRTVSFEASVDAIACTVGDVVLVAHDVPQWAKSGRIFSVDTVKNEMVLPVEIDNVDADYMLMYRTINDNLRSTNITILENGNGYCTVRCETAFDRNDMPQVNDIFDLALRNIGSKPFVVKSISRASDFTRKIECLEYNEAIFNEDYAIPPINYSSPDTGVENVRNLSVKQTKQIGNDVNYQYKLSASWEYDKEGTFIVYGSYDGENYTLLANGIKEHEFSTTTYNKMLLFRVVTKNGLRTSPGVVANVDLIDKIIIPECTDVEAHTKYREMNDDIVRYDIEVTWKPPVDDIYKQAQVWYKTNGTQCNNLGVIPEGIVVSELGFNGNWMFAGIGIDSVIIPQAIIGETYKIAVCAQDIYGNTEHPALAPQKTIIVAKKTETPDTPANLSVNITDTFNISWDEVRNADIKFYEVRTDNSYGAVNNLIARTSEISLMLNNVTNRVGRIYVYAVGAIGTYSNPAVIDYSFPALFAPSISATAKLQGIECSIDNIPSNAIGMHWYFNGANSNADIKVLANTHYQSLEAGVYDVSACYYDYFGDGALSDTKMVTISATIPPELIADESIMLEKLTTDAQKAIEEGGIDTVNIAVRGILGDGSALVLQPDGSYALVASNGEMLTGMFANNNGVITLQGKYTHITGDTKIDGNVITNNMLAGGISADKINVTSLSAISAKLGTMESISADGLSRTIVQGEGVFTYSRKNTSSAWVLRTRNGRW